MAFDLKAMFYIIRCRIKGCRDSQWEIQFSDDNVVWKSCTLTQLVSDDWNDITWRLSGSHRYWRFLIISNTGKRWMEKVEFYYVPSDIMNAMKASLLNSTSRM